MTLKGKSRKLTMRARNLCISQYDSRSKNLKLKIHNVKNKKKKYPGNVILLARYLVALTMTLK